MLKNRSPIVSGTPNKENQILFQGLPDPAIYPWKPFFANRPKKGSARLVACVATIDDAVGASHELGRV